MTFNEILEKGFDGHNFVSGLNSHLRDLLVSKDESTLQLLEATPSIRQRYLEQTRICPVDFLYRALDIGSSCDISYKSTKNPRLHVELSLIRLCGLTTDSSRGAEKKKSDLNNVSRSSDEIPLPSKSEIIRQVEEPVKPLKGKEPEKHMPVIEKPSRSFSIKEVITDNDRKASEPTPLISENKAKTVAENKVEMTGETLLSAWKEFVENIRGEGPRIISMFKSIRPEMEDDHTIRIHLTNAAQKDLFVQNYKPKLSSYLENKFLVSELDIETSVDLSETNELLYTDEQKYNYLSSKYPVLKDFKKTFNLDIP
jgi:DNA polymerase-3 subunit gamma/tau